MLTAECRADRTNHNIELMRTAHIQAAQTAYSTPHNRDAKWHAGKPAYSQRIPSKYTLRQQIDPSNNIFNFLYLINLYNDMDKFDKLENYATYLIAVTIAAAIFSIVTMVTTETTTSDTVAVLMAALSTLISATSIFITTTTNKINQQRDKDSGTSLKLNRNTRSTGTGQEPNLRRINLQQKQKYSKHTATKEKQ